MLQVTAGTGGAPLSLGDPANNLIVDYTMASPDANGVVQIAFQQNNAPFDQQAWDIRFTINDGVTSAAAQTGLTFVVDAVDARAPWLAVPGQLTLSPTGPSPIDFAAALTNITLAGTAGSGGSDQLEAGRTYTVLLPVGNYGAGPLTISGVIPTDMTNGFSIRLLTAPLKIAPGGVDKVTLQASFQAPPAGQNGGAATPTAFTLACNDPLAAISGATAHFNIVSLFARVLPAPSFAPSPHQFDPKLGPAAATIITLFGSHFDVGAVSVRFGNVVGGIVGTPTATQITACVPAMAAARLKITVQTAGGSVTSDDEFTVLPGPPNTWATKAPMPTARSGLGLAAASNGKLYAVGGTDTGNTTLATVEEYDPATDTWVSKAPMPTARADLGLAAASNGKLYAVGGGFLATVEEYDPATNTWATKAPMPTARSYLGLAAASNCLLYAVGGFVVAEGGQPGGSAVDAVEEYYPATDTWATKAPMPTARFGLGLSAASNDKLYAVGGGVLATVEEYDPATDTWATKASMPTARSGLGLAAASNGKLYAVGGTDTGNTTLATVEEYDPATNTWVSNAPMPTARTGLGLDAENGGKLLAVGGSPAAAVVEEYTP
jgi:N-acetylneuraminic acid mutarotase